MRFRQSSPPPYLSRAAQFRILRMMGLLVLVLILMSYAANPGMWTWLVPGKVAQEEKPAPKEIDYGLLFEEDSPLAPDAFRSRLADSDSKPSDSPAIAEAASDRTPTPGGADEKNQSAKVGDYRIEIDPEILAPVSDGWFGIRQHEAPAFFAIIAKAKDIPLKLLEDAGNSRVDYTVLMTDSETFRGQPLTVEGTVRMIESVSITDQDAEENFGVDHYFVAWMWTDSSGDSPYRLIATSLPEDMPLGKAIEVPAKFTGYFFKQEGYRTEQGFHRAPVLIGQRLRWNNPSASGPAVDMSQASYYVIGFSLLIALGLGVMIWRFKVSDKKFGQKHIEHFTTATPKDLEELAKLEPHDPNELFRQLEAEAKAQESVSQDS